MKSIFFIIFIYSFNIFSSDFVNWKTYNKNIDKPVFMLLVDNDKVNKTNDKIFSNHRLAKLLNEKFYPIKINIKKNPDFKNRYLFMVPPSVAILDKNGIIVIKKRNYSAITIEVDLLKYLESEKNKSIKKSLEQRSKEAMYKIFYASYFLENTKELSDRSSEIEFFIKKNLSLNTMYFNVRTLQPLYNYAYSVLNHKYSSYQKLLAQAHFDSVLSGKIFDKDHIFKSSFKDWSKPSKKISLKDNILLVEVLQSLNYNEIAKKVIEYLKLNYNQLSQEEKILFKTIYLNFNQEKTNLSELKEIVKRNKDSKYLSIQTAIFKAYLELYKHDKGIKKELLLFIKELENNFYDYEKGAFYDVKKGLEPFGFKYVEVIENIELAYLYTLLYKITDDFNNLITTKYILSLMNNTSIDNLVNSKYLLAIYNLNTAK